MADESLSVTHGLRKWKGFPDMARSPSFDVVVVGGGPGGAVAAKRCSEKGFATLLIEKETLPRDKVCTGMVMGDWAHDIIRQEFGEIPEAILVDPPSLSGHRFHVAGAEPQTLEWDTPLTWRKDLDFWMVQRAKEAGVTVKEGSRVTSLTSEEDISAISIRTAGVTEELTARFVIGADGAISAVRGSIFPHLKVKYSAPKREFYRGEIALERDIIHWFFPTGRPRPRFNVNHKDDVFLIEGSGIRELRSEITDTLTPYGFDAQTEPAKKDGCAVALLHDPLLAGTFLPAKGNTLLIGDAAGLIFPITFEGIGSALKSGIIAAEAIVKSADTAQEADGLYLKGLEPVVETIRRLCAVQKELTSLCDEGPDVMARHLFKAYEMTLTIQSR